MSNCLNYLALEYLDKNINITFILYSNIDFLIFSNKLKHINITKNMSKKDKIITDKEMNNVADDQETNNNVLLPLGCIVKEYENVPVFNTIFTNTEIIE